MKSFIVSGTDTNIGKTMLSALLMAAMPESYYWKPVQSGTEDGTDSETVQKLSQCDKKRILPEAFIFTQPFSPHLAARLDGKELDLQKLKLPDASPLIIEGAGGLMVPLTNDFLFVDQFKLWDLPVLLACRSSLGTINHTLLSLEALRSRAIPVLGCVPIGEFNEENEKAIERFGSVHVVGRIPKISTASPNLFRTIFDEYFTLLISALE